MCKKLNFVYMIDRMKYQYFDSITGANEKRENFLHRQSGGSARKKRSERVEKSFVDGKFYNHALYQLFRNFPLV